MSMEEFIKQNRDRIYNIDGNLDDGDISVMGDDMVLTFYYFKMVSLVRYNATPLSGKTLV
jgi:hypothetical protein